MYRLIPLCCVFCFCALAGGASKVLAQPTIFEPGYVVLVSGDTLRGEVALEADLLATRRAVFRGAEAEVVTFSPAELLGYGFDSGRQFQRYELAPGPGLELEPLFLRRLVAGRCEPLRVRL